MQRIETERLVLRLPQEEDAEIMLAIRELEFVQAFNCMTPWDLERMRGQIRKEREKKSALYLQRKEDGALLGGIWFDADDLRFGVKSLSLSYYLGEEFARQGYMKEVLAAAIHSFFENDPELELVSARVFSGNTASECLLRSLGFHYEGCLRRCVRDPRGIVHDDMQFSLLREEWE